MNKHWLHTPQQGIALPPALCAHVCVCGGGALSRALLCRLLCVCVCASVRAGVCVPSTGHCSVACLVCTCVHACVCVAPQQGIALPPALCVRAYVCVYVCVCLFHLPRKLFFTLG